MIVKTLNGTKVVITRTDRKSLFDDSGAEWIRYPANDDAETGKVGYMNPDTKEGLAIHRHDMKRILRGNAAILEVTCVEELRWAVTKMPPKIQKLVDQWSDQTMRETLGDAEEKGKDPAEYLLERAFKELEQEEKQSEPEPTREDTHGSPRKPLGAHGASREYKNTRKRRQDGSVTLDLGDTTVVLTPKQLEFMERLSECPEWDGNPTGRYNASEYAQELADTMNPMSVGAVLTTLREKHLLTTEKVKIGAIKSCVFTLTEAGVRVYNKLAGGEANGNSDN